MMQRKHLAWGFSSILAALPGQALADPGGILHDIGDGLLKPYFIAGACLFFVATVLLTLRRRSANARSENAG